MNKIKNGFKNFKIVLYPKKVLIYIMVVIFVLVGLSLTFKLGSQYFLSTPLIKIFDTDNGLNLFNVDSEQNIPTYFSSNLLLFSSLILGFIAYFKRLQRDKFNFQWKIMSFIFLWLSIDEFCQLHEKLTPATDRLFPYLKGFLHMTRSSWIIIGSLLVILFIIFFAKLLFSLPSKTRKGFILSGLIYVGGAIVMETINRNLFTPDNSFTYVFLTTLEEFMEMTGISVFIYSLLTYIKDLQVGTILFSEDLTDLTPD